MCGIVGYAGTGECVRILLEGLRRLEYRGYDSAGIAVIGKGRNLQLVRCQGKISALESRLENQQLTGTTGIAHTRWATHGKPSDDNAHPHRSGPFVVVHNGIIENYAELKIQLEREGFTFSSETDTEVIVKLVEREWLGGNSYRQSVVNALRQVCGSYAVVFLNQESPEELIAARKESPLILGLGDEEYFLASDVPAILPYTRKVVYLEDGDLIVVSRKGYRIETIDGQLRDHVPQVIDWNPVMAEKAGYKHFMLKEINEQPRAVIDTFRGALDLSQQAILLPDLNLTAEMISKINRIFLVACGTSYHAGLVAKYMMEKLCRVPVDVDLASEFRYRSPLIDKSSLLLVISQSGETADTRAALQEGLDKGACCRAIVNVVGSSIERMSEGVIYTHAGPEIGVASTKAFTAQLVALYLFSLHLASIRGQLLREQLSRHIQDLLEVPGKMDEVLSNCEQITEWAKRYVQARDFLYLARGILYPIALEGALKLKEISYIHAEGYAAGEMKHGPIALIDEDMPVVVLLQRGSLFEKMLSNVQEVKARGGQLITMIEERPDAKVGAYEEQLVLPATSEWLAPLIFTLPLQLLAYQIAALRGTDVDQPRNLAKSVTVE
ncbi:MAG: glutamine--fructose-6-phosphate transaminase (isomerizing) [Desulforhabdus sp.]|jgi:glucosamine--fructose-6-phosphate aminotransferase (isomerizing)|nr:glutamine--fructose-6-phosphate transaminase (isomerizing) [Desulforhabdus sp.]